MKECPLPSSFLPAGCLEPIRAAAALAEEARDLHPDQLAVIYREKWLRLFVPGLYQGLAMALPEAVRLEEGISWGDGSVGWLVTLCSGAGWFGGFLPQGVFSSLLSDPRLCLAGSGAITGVAVPTAHGYRINGRWDYASGALHATAFTANCVIKDTGHIRAFLFTKEEVKVHSTWDTIGLIATGSHSFEVTDLEVSSDRCFEISSQRVTIDDPLYHYPFLVLAETTLAANLSGMAVHFLDCCEVLFREKMKDSLAGLAGELSVQLSSARSALQHARQNFYSALDQSWDVHKRGVFSSAAFQLASRSSHELVACARQVVDKLYPFGGLTAARPRSEINRVWRDIHTASQHRLLAFPPVFPA